MLFFGFVFRVHLQFYKRGAKLPKRFQHWAYDSHSALVTIVNDRNVTHQELHPTETPTRCLVLRCCLGDLVHIPPQYSFYQFGTWEKRLKRRPTVCSLRQGQRGGGGGGCESEFSRVTSHKPPISERVFLHVWSRISKDGAMVKSTLCFKP